MFHHRNTYMFDCGMLSYARLGLLYNIYHMHCVNFVKSEKLYLLRHI